MNFIWKLTLSRMLRQKVRLLFVLLAIAASSCLVVWTIGGFQALFIDATTGDVDHLGNYDLRVAAALPTSMPDLQAQNAQGGKGNERAFKSPLARPDDKQKQNAEKDAKKPVAEEKNEESVNERSESENASGEPQNGANGRSENANKPRGGPRGGFGGRMFGMGAPALEIPETLAAEMRADDAVAICDEVSTLRMYVYSPGVETSILEDSDGVDEGLKPTLKRALSITDEELAAVGEAPKGVDPELHRKALAAYRATMGTPLGKGSTFQATTAGNSPYEIQEGRWFESKAADGTVPFEAVLTTKGVAKFNAKVGDTILLLDNSSQLGISAEYQLSVVGIVDDVETDSFYVSRELANAISKSPVKTNSLYVKLRGDVNEFRDRWNARFEKELPGAKAVTKEEIKEAIANAMRDNQAFKYQFASGTLLAALAALLIVFTALNMSVDEEKRLIAFYRLAGLTRSQVGRSILIEATILALPGWVAGMLSGWALVSINAGKVTGLNPQTVGYSFVCTFIGGVLAAMYPIFRSARVRPLDAIGAPEKKYDTAKTRRRQNINCCIATAIGVLAIAADLYLVHHLPGDSLKRAALHSGYGVALLAVGVVCMLPLTIRLAEMLLLPILAWIFRFDAKVLRRELSGNASRVIAVSVALSVGGGLFCTMQIWGYSMLDPFLPGRRTPDAFAAFLPNGLRPEIVDELKKIPNIDMERFIPVAVEQAAFTADLIPDDERKKEFANVVFFGVDVEKAFLGRSPLVGMRFRQGSVKDAVKAMKDGRGVIVTDSLPGDYNLKLGDTLKVIHPRDPEKVLEYPIVGVVSFPGWQWLSKTGGVRRNFGRSGGVVFAREDIIASDYDIERRSYFWFDSKDGKIDYASTEFACDYLARKNLAADVADGTIDIADVFSQTAYVKLSTRESLTESISSRADSVIWALSKTPLTTLIISAIAVVGAIANSVRARRWVYGVMRAVGMTRWAIIRAILVEAILIGVVASIASFSFGFLAAHGVLKLGQSMFGSFDPPLVLPFKGLALGFGLTLALCMAAAIYPAIKTGRTETLKLLQGGRSVE